MSKPKRFLSVLDRELVRLTQEQYRTTLNLLMNGKKSELLKVSDNPDVPILTRIAAKQLINAQKAGNIFPVHHMLDYVIGKPKLTVSVEDPSSQVLKASAKVKTFTEFCIDAGYPAPYPKQLEMRAFCFDLLGSLLLLGSRGYGKTDYLTILGVAYEIYLDVTLKRFPLSTFLIITKSKVRNDAIVTEIHQACIKNGVVFEKVTNSVLRVKGHVGKDHTVEALPLNTKSFRGRHPRRIIMDDPVTEEDVSEATRKHLVRKYNEINKLTKNIVIIGQPVHKVDLYAKLRPLLQKMEVPHGTMPELDHDLEAQRLAGVSEASISASYHLKVLSETGFPFEMVNLVEMYTSGDSFAFIDPSFKGGDFTAMTVLRGHFDGVIVEGYVWKKAWNHCLPEIKKVCKALKVRKLGFEVNSLGDMPLNLLRGELTEDNIGWNVGVVGKNSNTAKHSRIVAAGVYSQLIHLSKKSDREYLEQVVNYEYGAGFDDAPDSLASALELVGLIRGKQNL